MAEKELLMSIDDVRFLRPDTHVLLTHTEDAYSIGVIRTPFDGAVLVAAFKRPVMNVGIPLNPTLLMGALDIVIAKHERHALDMALHMLHTWTAARTPGYHGQQYLFAPSDFTEVVKDAPPGESPFTMLGGGRLNRRQQLERTEKLGYIRKSGFMFPLSNIIAKVRDQLA